MKRALELAVGLVTLSASSVAQADLSNNQGIQDHVDAILVDVDTSKLDRSRVRTLLANRRTPPPGARDLVYSPIP